MVAQLNDFDLTILRILSKTSGLNAPKILEKLKGIYSNATLDMIKNFLKRKLFNLCEFRGNYKTGGYYLKENK